ncbi:restriction endonuclease subunit S [Mesoflavibacter zeaxanthinifaciens]|uniref:restriction endonuclease subunit S n=1 Tax=Mesoflavibacter zeaxanthinifaciens TaxID=393060 RepID=UPI003A9024CC
MGKWKEVKLGDGKVTEVIMGQSPPSSTYNSEGIGLPFYQGKKEFGELYPTVEKWCSKPNKIAESGDVLLSVRAPVGPTNLAFEKCCIGRGLASIRPNLDLIETKFLLFYFQNFELEISSKGQGSTFQAISGKELRNLKIPLPPLPEQQRIVAKLDGLFAKIDQAISLLEANLQHTQALMGSVLDEEFGKLENYNIQTIDEIKESNVIGLVRSVKTQSYDKEFEYMKMNNITKNGTLDLSDLVSVDATKEEFEKFKLKKGDFLFNTRNSIELVGKTAVYNLNKPMIFNNNIMRLRFKDNIDPNFVNFQFFSNKTKADLEKIKSGTTNVAAIYYKTFKNLELKIPDIKVQNLLVKKLLDFSKKIELIKESQTQKLDHLKALKSSLLDQAFKGEL